MFKINESSDVKTMIPLAIFDSHCGDYLVYCSEDVVMWSAVSNFNIRLENFIFKGYQTPSLLHLVKIMVSY